jgi:hypothetical protein
LAIGLSSWMQWKHTLMLEILDRSFRWSCFALRHQLWVRHISGLMEFLTSQLAW